MHRYQHSFTVFASNIIVVRIVFAIAASIVVIIATIVIMLVFIIVPAAGDQSRHERSRHGTKKAWRITVMLGMVMLVMAMVMLTTTRPLRR